ncbi:efflux RND transporter permease subunit [Chryseobacterium sp.]|uniref:efflux RND transporter permease subunit n=1 Tax=Chryseobacterium sp. TaxID=1871047 RepID=UPI002899559F|nr:efflux RND transporter permease subunit [Chryseobacterium sp.]
MNTKNNFIATAMKYNKIVLLLISTLIIFGVYALFKMPKQEFPTFTIRQGVVVAVYPGATAEEVEEQVAKPLENFLFTYKEIKKSKTYSQSRDGMLYVFVELNDDVKNKTEVWSKIKLGLSNFKMQLPSGVVALVANDDFGDTSALLIALESDTKTYRQMKYYMEDLESRLRSIESVSNLRRYGEQKEQISIYIDKEKIASYGINIYNLYQTLMSKGFVGPAGTIDNKDLSIPIHIDRPFTSEYDLQEQIIYSDPTGNQIRLKDVGKIVREYPKAKTYTLNNNHKCLILSTEMREGYNIVDYGTAVNKVLKDFEKTLPNDVKVFRIADQPQVVDHSIDSFLKELAIAILAVVLVTVVLMPLRVAMVAGSTIPISIFITLALMFTFGIELNTVTLAALIVVLGMIVDNSIVILDGYLEKLDEGMPRREAAIKSAGEYFKAVLSATLAIGVTFFPFLLTLTGQMRDFVGAFPWTVLLALGVSLAVAVLFVPFLMYTFIKKGLHDPNADPTQKRKSVIDRIQVVYDSILEKMFRFPKISFAVGISAALIGIVLFSKVPLKLMPFAERNQFAIEIYLPNGTSINETEKVALDLQKKLQKDKRITSLTLFMGSGSPRFHTSYAPKIGGSNFAQFIVNTENADATVDIINENATKMAYHYPNAFVKFKQLDFQADVDADSEIRLTGNNIADLKQEVQKLEMDLKKMDSPLRIYTNYQEVLPDVTVALDPVESNRLGISEGSLGISLASRFGGVPITSIWENDYNVPVVLKSSVSGDSLKPGDVQNEYITGMFSPAVPLRQVAKVTTGANEGQIVRRNGLRTLSLYIDFKRGSRVDTEQKKVEAIVDKHLKEINDKNIKLNYGGVKENTAETLPKIIGGLLISIAIIYFILVFHFKKIKLASLVFLSTIFSFLGAALGLIIMDLEFSMTSVLGLVSLIGIIVRNGIIMYDYIEELRHKEHKSVKEACIMAGARRMRPILLTCLAASMGVIPMIISNSPLWAPMGTVIFFGTLISMGFILTMLPLLYWVAYKNEDEQSNESLELV